MNGFAPSPSEVSAAEEPPDAGEGTVVAFEEFLRDEVTGAAAEARPRPTAP